MLCAALNGQDKEIRGPVCGIPGLVSLRTLLLGKRNDATLDEHWRLPLIWRKGAGVYCAVAFAELLAVGQRHAGGAGVSESLSVLRLACLAYKKPLGY
jgi:hypothetical protein